MQKINLKQELKINTIPPLKIILNPDYIFMPIKNDCLIDCNYVYKASNLFFKSMPISGYIKGLSKDKNYLIIANDFREEEENSKTKLNKNKILEKIILDYKLETNLKTLYINCIDLEVTCYNKYYLLKEEKNIIIRVLDFLYDNLKINEIVLVVDSSFDISEFLEDYLSLNYKFKVVPAIYPIGHPKILKEYLNDFNTSLIDLNDLIVMYNKLYKKRDLIEKYITVSGDALEQSLVLKVKLYTRLKDYLKYINIKETNYDILINNSLCGKSASLNLIIDEKIETIIINKKKKIYQGKCQNCGLCNEVCPVRINPLKKNEKCIKCGLCNYVCPENIDILEVQND